MLAECELNVNRKITKTIESLWCKNDRMSHSDFCRLCFTTENDNHLHIFSVIGIELKMGEIIAEHFKCEISETDSLPNFVCHACWSTTEAFHELYQRSKTAQEKFINPMIKIEEDVLGLWQENYGNDRDFIDDSQLEVCAIKVEPHLDSDDQDALDSDTQLDNTREFTEREEYSPNNQNDVPDMDESNASDRPRQSNRKLSAKRKTNEFKKIFNENKYRFDMTCDSCSNVFDSLDDARTHYANVHDNSKGYIKCCNVKLTYRCEVVRHLYRHLEPDKFKCKKCGKVYQAMHALKAHMKLHTENTEKEYLICDLCKKSFASKMGLKRHLQWHHRCGNKSMDGQYKKFMAENFDMKCDLCDVVFSTFHDARYHYREYHNDKKGYIKCCNIKLRELWIVMDHINSHLNPHNFKCDLCNKNFSSGMRLNQHKGRHRRAIERPFICDICGKTFRDKETITRHLFTTHVDSEPKYECEICHKRFQLSNLLKNHVYAVHREKKPIVTCEICGKSFHVKASFDKHMLSHTDKSERLAQRKQCEHCGEWLMTKSGIYYHEQIHTSGIQKCEQCQMELPHKIALLAHIRKYHRERNHKCSYCDKTFPVSSELKKHEEGHTRHNVYPCQFCTKVFTLRTSRLTHQKRTHREELKHLREMRKLMKHTASAPT